jgi:hypothetical protein
LAFNSTDTGNYPRRFYYLIRNEGFNSYAGCRKLLYIYIYIEREREEGGERNRLLGPTDKQLSSE